MPDAMLPGMDYEPQRDFIVRDVEALKVYFDPLRLRITQEIADRARSIHEIADALGIPFTRLYYHINLLEKNGFIKLVDVRQGAGAIEEKYYRVAARIFSVDRALMTPGTPTGDAGLEAVLDTVLEETRRSVYTGIDAGVLDTSQRVPHPDALLMVRGVFSLTPELAVEFQSRLKELLIEFTSRQLSSLDGTRVYNLAVALHPTVLSEDETPDEVLPFDEE